MPRFARFSKGQPDGAPILINLEHIVTVVEGSDIECNDGQDHATSEIILSTGLGKIPVLGSINHVQTILETEYGNVIDAKIDDDA